MTKVSNDVVRNRKSDGTNVEGWDECQWTQLGPGRKVNCPLCHLSSSIVICYAGLKVGFDTPWITLTSVVHFGDNFF